MHMASLGFKYAPRGARVRSGSGSARGSASASARGDWRARPGSGGAATKRTRWRGAFAAVGACLFIKYCGVTALR